MRSIIPSISKGKGHCSYCVADDVALVSPEQLADYFGLLANIYGPDTTGKSLLTWFKEDWDLFHNGAVDDATATKILEDIYRDSKFTTELFTPLERYKSDKLNQWEKLRAELMYENRYFPETILDDVQLDDLLSHLAADDFPTQWFRARLQPTDKPFGVAEMGPPPSRGTSIGRANPAGIPYLYLASTPETAVSEVRPHTGETACVAEFHLIRAVTAVDLRNPRRLVSPFVLADESAIGLLRYDITLLEKLGEELTRPILPQGAPIDYVPSQYLCEFIKKVGYDGVVYRSSVSDGINLALFDPTAAQAKSVDQYRVAQVLVSVAKL